MILDAPIAPGMPGLATACFALRQGRRCLLNR